MTNLIGLAFTSPQIAIMVTDREQFRVHYYQNRPHELHAFLQEKDDRLPVVILKSVHDLGRVKSVKGVHAMMLFDDPETMAKIDGINILDAVPDSEFSGYRKRVVPREKLNEALSKEGKFTFDPKALGAVKALSSDITFRELVQTTVGKHEVPEDFLENVCLYLLGAMQKKSWVARVQKKGLSAGIPVEKMAELEKFIEQAPAGERLWRALYEVYEGGVSAQDAADQLEADEDDINFVSKLLGKREGLRYSRNPRDKPMVVKKPRKKRLTAGQKATKKERQKGGRSISTKKSSVDKKKLAKAQKENEEMTTTGFDLVETLKRIDDATKSGDIPYAFSRMACARLCGLVKARPYNAACKQAVADGADKQDVASVRSYIKDDPEAKALWLAYCQTAYFVEVSPEDAAKEAEVPATKLNAVTAYKPMAYVFEFVNWPKQLE